MPAHRSSHLATAAIATAIAALPSAALAQDDLDFTAYQIAAVTIGNQQFGGSLGLDFDVTAALTVTDLGAFDSGADGLALPITVEIWTRDNATTPLDPVDDFGLDPLLSLDFTPAEPGELDGGAHRFKPLADPLDLPVGSYTIIAWGYGAGEPNANRGAANPPDGANFSTESGGVIDFVGRSRWGDATTFPANADGGPADRYGAGSFKFTLADTDDDGMPDVYEQANGLEFDNPDDAAEDDDLDTIDNLTEYLNGTNPQSDDTDNDTVKDQDEAALGTDPNSPDSDGDSLDDGDELTAATDPLDPDTDSDGFGDGFEATHGSNPTLGASLPATTVAINSPFQLPGNQPHGGPLASDFSTIAAITLTEIGAFDDSGDGFFNPITVEIWQRDDLGTPEDPTDDLEVFDQPPLVTLTIEPSEGILQGSHRYKPLPAPFELPAGIYTLVAHGFSTLDRNLNAFNAPTSEDAGLFPVSSPVLAFDGVSRFGPALDVGFFPVNIDGPHAVRYGAGSFLFTLADSDDDGMPDFYEDQNGFAKNDPSDGPADRDSDDLSNADEFLNGTGPDDPDSDDDGTNDGAEIAAGTDPLDPDSDDDGIDDTTELADGSDPHALDSDNDGFTDLREKNAGTSPTDANDTPTPANSGQLAYRIEAGTVATQTNHPGTLGLDFDVTSAVTVTELGVFDDGADGIFRPLVVQLWSRDENFTPGDPSDDFEGTMLAELTFTTALPGDLRGGHRSKPLPVPLVLQPGAYTIVSDGHGPGEGNYNSGNNPDFFAPLSRSDDPAISFVGTGRFGQAGFFPLNNDGGPEDRYGVGTFAFTTDTPPAAEFTITAVGFDDLTREITLTWNATPGTSYAVEYLDNGTTDWLGADDGLLATGPSRTFTHTVPANVTTRLYRVVAE